MVPAVVEQIKSVVKGFAAGAGAGAASAGAAGVADCFELVEDVEGIWNFLRMNKYVGSLEEEEEEEEEQEEVAEDEEGDDDNDDNDVNDNNDEEQQAERERPTSLYKCHTCRTTLFDSTSVSPHNPTCNSIHIVHPNPLTKDVGYTPNSGKLYCFKCKNKVGSYNWSGVKCACKHWWQGGCTVNKSSVDEEDVKVVLQGVEKLVLKESSEGAGIVDVKVVVSRDVVRSQEEVAAEKKGQQEKGGFRHDRGKSKPKHPTHKNFGKKDSSIGSFA
ncbi:hypothetical protein TrVE_jg9575 [Triparma verrucosa]|uniref:Uncharacterized protein n=1 Tax=Triparma verrucosa TaxID=1606542 RepID=A0A9W7BT13_9STRA|nr:hypothetical protein TrVE_jg9575 [Triparma verrucosa]